MKHRCAPPGPGDSQRHPPRLPEEDVEKDAFGGRFFPLIGNPRALLYEAAWAAWAALSCAAMCCSE